jgi:hypothetical protein
VTCKSTPTRHGHTGGEQAAVMGTQRQAGNGLARDGHRHRPRLGGPAAIPELPIAVISPHVELPGWQAGGGVNYGEERRAGV